MADSPRPVPVSFSEFEPVTTAQWQQRLSRDLKGADLTSLQWHTPDGLTIEPFYHREALEVLGGPPSPLLHTSPEGWRNVPTYQVPAKENGHTAIDRAAAAITLGATGAHFALADAPSFDVEYLHQHLPLHATYVGYTVHQNPSELVQRLLATGTPTLQGFLSCDPITNHAPDLSLQLISLRKAIALTQPHPGFHALALNGAYFANRGGNITQQLGFLLAAAAAYLSELPSALLSVADVAAAMQVQVGLNPSYFPEIAKLRALRRLWATLLHAYSVPMQIAEALPIFATTATWSQTTLDAHTNLLRVTTETMAAVLGGADAVSVTPFDSIFHEPNEFSERLARNLPILLREEAFLGRVADPAAGSYYLETLTDKLASEGWSLFQKVEAQGGLPAAASMVALELHGAAQAQFHRIATGEQVVVGTNRFQNPQEKFDFNPKKLLRSKNFDSTRATYPTEVLRLATALHFERREKKNKRAAVVLLGPGTNQLILESFLRTLPHQERPEIDAAHPAGTLSVLFSSPEEVTLMYATPTQFRELARVVYRVEPSDDTFVPPTLLTGDLATLQEGVRLYGFQEFTVQGYSTEDVLARLQGR
ncbi:methylmalonyl-CoA mutase family protein [Hymenobacter sp. BT730]|uniref:methylmalonyl-CoA mutase family protein n=1 Tax=Hymenobacter sp. BT730 TaxID=3063332 RepID=UPI0026DF5F6A|nr:methylmalonyl-CoA mutase family protein [Hymenobacter sp. BT730]